MWFRSTLSLSVIVALSACSDSNFKGETAKATKTQSVCLDAKPPQNSRCLPVEPISPPPPVVTHEAVFAVRNMSCSFCHAKIDSNVISDFASQTGPKSAAESLAQMIHMTKDAREPEKKHRIAGKFIVPAGDTYGVVGTAENCTFDGIVDHSKLDKTVPVSLIDVLNKCVSNSITWGAGSERFVTRKTVSINPVSSPDVIKAIATNESAKLAANGFTAIGEGTVSGFTGSKASGYKASSKVTCEGAVVFDGPVLIKDSTISTQKGCRVYSTRSIFVFGAVSVSGPEEAASLQLMSPIFVGFDIGLDKINSRLLHGSNLHQIFSIGSRENVKSMIASDARLVGAEIGGGTGVSYSKLAVAAPIVYTLNSGDFSGFIIAEQFLGRIGALSFSFDPVFKSSTSAPAIFPEIKTDLVTVSSD